jgi:hypothetical protein
MTDTPDAPDDEVGVWEIGDLTVKEELDACTDLAVLRALARRWRNAMLGQHEQVEHVLAIADCPECTRARDECDGALACAAYRRRQAEYEAALAAGASTQAGEG